MKLSLKNSKNECCLLFSMLVIFFLPAQTRAQVISLDSLSIGDITCATTDLYGNLYLSDNRGQLIRIEPDPVHIVHFSGKQVLAYTKIDAGTFNKIAVFSKDLQQINFFDRNLNPLGELTIDPHEAPAVTSFCLSSDNSLWLYDESSLTLKKISVLSGQEIMTVNCGPEFQGENVIIRDMRDYQNRLYLLNDNQSLYIFDNMGNFIKSIGGYSGHNLQFINVYLVSVSDHALKLINIYDGMEKEKQLEGIDSKDTVIISKKFMYLISRRVRIRPFPGGID